MPGTRRDVPSDRRVDDYAHTRMHEKYFRTSLTLNLIRSADFVENSDGIITKSGNFLDVQSADILLFNFVAFIIGRQLIDFPNIVYGAVMTTNKTTEKNGGP